MKSTKSIWITAVLAFLAGAALPIFLIWNPAHWSWAEQVMHRMSGPGADGESEETQLWTCGMHPQVLQEEPGLCPICNMNLVPLKEEPAPQASEEPKERKIRHWVAPMDPNYISDKPGKSPMGMDLVPVYEEEEATEATGVHVDPNFIQNFAVRTTEAQKGSIPIRIRTIGTLDYNQKNIVSVNTKFEGWIEKANVNYIGESVQRGDVLFEIYSPPLVTTQQEYLATLDYLEKLRAGGDEEAISRAKSLLEATHERLHYWDITDDQIDSLKSRKKPMRTLKILSPVSGTVIEKMGDSLEGMKLTPGMNVFKIADLSNVWAKIEVFEHQIQYLKLDQTADIALDAFPGRHWTGKIIYLNPTLNPKTRTLTAYVEISNQDSDLRPEMYANVEIRVPAVSGAVKIPSEAILHTGERSVVIVEKEKGYFVPREVTLGVEGEGYSQVTKGLREGETVILSSQFLIDSESNLREAVSKMLADRKKGPDNPPAPEHVH